MDGLQFAIHGTGYPLPSGYDGLSSFVESVIPAWIAGIQVPWMAYRLPSMALDTRIPAGMTRCFGLAGNPVIPAWIHAGLPCPAPFG